MTQATIFEALAGEYWRKAGYDPLDMAKAAAKAAGVKNADLKAVKKIVERNLDPVNFTLMADQILEELEGAFIVNGYSFDIGQIVHGKHKDQWTWTLPAYDGVASESEAFDTACEAQQDAMSYVREREAEERDKPDTYRAEVTQLFDRRDYQ